MNLEASPQIEEVKTLTATLIGDLTLCRWTSEKSSGYVYMFNVEQHHLEESSIKNMRVAEETFHPKIVGYSSTSGSSQPYLDTGRKEPEYRLEENLPRTIKVLYLEPFDESLKNEFLRRRHQGEKYSEAEIWRVLFGVLKVAET